MSHSFGDLLSQHLHRKHGLSQAKLAAGILQDPAVIAKMARGQRLTGPQARERVLAVIGWLREQGALSTQAEADALLIAAGLAPLNEGSTAEVFLQAKLTTANSQQDRPVELLPTRSKHNLLEQLTTFVGRDDELAQLEKALSQTRLITLHGVGGAGKTRLAHQLGARTRERCQDGVFFSTVAALSAATLVPDSILEALHIQPAPGRSAEQALIDHFAARNALLILDNCEHMLDACASLANRLLQQCPHLTILATSREPLGIHGETIWKVKPLSPHAAEQLFLDRARSVAPDLDLDAGATATIRQICARLDGLPLAIELAASRLLGLSLEQIASRLDDKFNLLQQSVREASPRHRTLRTTINWSYDLLTDDERTLFRRLSVFAGGWTLAAAVSVCVTDNGAPAVEQLVQLVRKSLVTMDPGAANSPEARYRFLETIREYASEELHTCGETQRLRAAHAAYFTQLAKIAEPELNGQNQKLWLNRLDKEQDNFRAALSWAVSEDQPVIAAELGGSLWHYWYMRVNHQEGSRWLEQISSLDISNQNRATLLYGLGMLARRFGNDDAVHEHVSAALALYRASADTYGIASSLRVLGFTHYRRGDRERAESYLQEALSLFRKLVHSEGIAATLANLAYVKQYERDWPAAKWYLEESLAIRRASGNSYGMTVSLDSLGVTSIHMGDLMSAKRYLQESAALNDDVGNTNAALTTRLYLGYTAICAGEFDKAQESFDYILAHPYTQNNAVATAITNTDLALNALYAGSLDACGRYLQQPLQHWRMRLNHEGCRIVLSIFVLAAMRKGFVPLGVRVFEAYLSDFSPHLNKIDPWHAPMLRELGHEIEAARARCVDSRAGSDNKIDVTGQRDEEGDLFTEMQLFCQLCMRTSEAQPTDAKREARHKL